VACEIESEGRLAASAIKAARAAAPDGEAEAAGRLENLMFSVDYQFQDNFAATEFLSRCNRSPMRNERFAHGAADNLLKLDNGKSELGTGSCCGSALSGTDCCTRTRIQWKIGRALISALAVVAHSSADHQIAKSRSLGKHVGAEAITQRR
jgi:hypothetical protein